MATALGVLRQQAVRRYLGSTAFAAIGINICITALFKQVYDITGDPFSIGLLGLAQFVPGLVLAIPSGYIADRFDRRRVTAVFLMLRLLSIACSSGSLTRAPLRSPCSCLLRSVLASPMR